MKLQDGLREIRLTEYQKAQDSAEHHNTIMWTLINVGIGFSLTILYLVWTTQNLDALTKLISLFIGALTLFYFSFIIETSNERIKIKYNLCKQIEKEYKFIGQHSLIKDFLGIKNGGIMILRLMKLILFFMYLLSIIVLLTKVEFNLFILIGVIFSIPAVIISMIIEIIYIKRG